MERMRKDMFTWYARVLFYSNAKLVKQETSAIFEAQGRETGWLVDSGWELLCAVSGRSRSYILEAFTCTPENITSQRILYLRCTNVTARRPVCDYLKELRDQITDAL